MLLELCGKPLLQRSFENIRDMELFDDVYIATDSEEIHRSALTWGAKVVMTGTHHQSGTSRIHEAQAQIDADVFVNVQGDEPFVEKKPLNDLIQCMKATSIFEVATLAYEVFDKELAMDVNKVKVVCDVQSAALYFSRSLIPYPRDGFDKGFSWLIHIGVYAYSKKFFKRFNQMGKTMLEEMEKLEQNRFLFAGVRPGVVISKNVTMGIDTHEDLVLAREKIKAAGRSCQNNV